MLTRWGVPALLYATVTVGHLHGYLLAWCDLLGLSTSGQNASGTARVTEVSDP